MTMAKERILEKSCISFLFLDNKRIFIIQNINQVKKHKRPLHIQFQEEEL
uniref:Uncharacterized protein n=1 Tax=Rhizophora mucronata TaxID=61149 RepID=A0A2P2QW85_RHIMU